MSESFGFDPENESKAEEMRRCTVVGCGRELRVSIEHGEPTDEDLERLFATTGWRGYFCPSHAHLAGRNR